MQQANSQVLHLTNPDMPDKLAEAQIDTPKNIAGSNYCPRGEGVNNAGCWE